MPNPIAQLRRRALFDLAHLAYRRGLRDGIAYALLTLVVVGCLTFVVRDVRHQLADPTPKPHTTQAQSPPWRPE